MRCHRGGLRGVSGRVSPAGRLATASAARAADTPRPRRCRLTDSAGRGAPRAGTASRRRRGPGSIGLGPSRFVSGRRARPETISRPLVCPTYAQGSYYGTKQVLGGAPGRLTGPAAPRLSTTRAAQNPGRDRRRSRSSAARTGRVCRNNRTRAPRGREGGTPGAHAGGRHARSPGPGVAACDRPKAPRAGSPDTAQREGGARGPIDGADRRGGLPVPRRGREAAGAPASGGGAHGRSSCLWNSARMISPKAWFSR